MGKKLNVGIIKPKGSSKDLKITSFSISDKTYELLYITKFGWWDRGLENDLDDQKLEYKIESNFEDIFYRITNKLIFKRFGISPNEYDVLDIDYSDNEIFIDIQLL
jgi:hypothetical protein